MYNVFLDTNIYRSLGLRFSKHRDYQHLTHYLGLNDNEFGMIGVVQDELVDYYRKDVFGKLFNDYKRLLKQFDENPFLRKIPAPDFEVLFKEAMLILENDFYLTMQLHVEEIPTDLLVKFLLANKADNRGDNTRDFLIFYSLIVYCEQEDENKVVLISNDKIFRQNHFFLAELEKRKISNFEVYESIAAFMAKVGPKIDWLDKEVVRAAIDEKIIFEELSNDVTCLPSYLSRYYIEKNTSDLPVLADLQIKSFEIKDFYTSLDDKTNEITINVDVRVKPYVIFDNDPYPEELKNFLDSNPMPTESTPETFDEKGRLIYQEDILFLFEGKINEQGKNIEGMRFIDFFPSYFRYDNMVLGPAYRLVPVNNSLSMDLTFKS